MWPFKTKPEGNTREEIEAEKLREEKETEERELIKKGDSVELFPGSLKEYQIMKGAEYEIVNTGRPDKAIYFRCDLSDGFSRPNDCEDAIKLGELGAEALIRYHIIGEEISSYDILCSMGVGIPVRRKQKGEQYAIE